MKLHLPITLLAAVLACITTTAKAAFTPTTSLGNIMYVGDSITHGYGNASYRWDLHKIFADNGIDYNSIGYKTGNNSGGIAPGTIYGNVSFNNVHSAQSSARAYEIAGRKAAGRFDNSNIQNWLGQSDIKTNGQAYTGPVFDGNLTPDNFFMMIGTNDLLSDSNVTQFDALLNDVKTIVDSMTTANPAANVILTTIPCWTAHSNSNTAEKHQFVADYNTALSDWAKTQDKVTVVDVNKGMIDVASDTPFYGVQSMFRNPTVDGLHPNNQGNLIIGGNIAKSLGFAGRSAGQKRKGNNTFTTNFYQGSQFTVNSIDDLTNKGFQTTNISVANNKINFGNAGLSSLTYNWAPDTDLTKGFTVDFNLNLGNGATGGWNTSDQFSVTLGNGTFSGTLNINEAYIQWGDTILYSMDMSTNLDNLRIAYVNGDSANNLSSGYYVWLGDMLIGEGLSSTANSTINGLNISYSGSGNASLSDLALDGTNSYAPTTNGMLNQDKVYEVGDNTSDSTLKPGQIEWKIDGFTAISENLTASGAYNIRNSVPGATSGAGSIISGTVTGGSAANIYANNGNFTGDVWATISGGSATDWIGGHTSGILEGNVYLKITDGFTSTKTVFGAVNGTSVNGNIYVELSAKNASYTTWTNKDNKSSVVGSYGTNVNGNITIVINEGSFANKIAGGMHSSNGKFISGNTSIFINGGSFSEEILGGGYSGTIKGNSSVFVSGGTILSNIYGGGNGDTIEGTTGVIISGNEAVIKNGDTWGTINGGNMTGNINNNSSVTIANLIEGNKENGFDKFAGTISGGTKANDSTSERSFILNNVQLDEFKATLTNFDKVSVQNGTSTSLTSLGGATHLSIDNTSQLIFKSFLDTDLTTTELSGGIVLDIATAGTFKVGGLKGTIDQAFINTGKNKDLILELSQGDLEVNSKVSYSGQIYGDGQILKTGNHHLSIGGLVKASSLTVEEGTLSLRNAINEITGTMTVSSGATLNLGSDLSGRSNTAQITLIDMLDLQSGSTLNLVGGNILSISNEAASNIVIDGNITGYGLLDIVKGNFSLGTGSLSQDISIILGKEAAVTINKDQTLDSIQGEGTLNLGDNNTLTIGELNSTFTGTLEGSGTIIQSGNNTSTTLIGSGNSQVNLTLNGGQLKISGGTDSGVIHYGNLQVNSGTLSIGDGKNKPDTFFDSFTMASGSSLKLLYSEGTQSGISSPVAIKSVQAAQLGDINLDIRSSVHDFTDYNPNGFSFTLIEGETGVASIGNYHLTMGFLSSLFKWSVQANGSDIVVHGKLSTDGYYTQAGNTYNSIAAGNLLDDARFDIATENNSVLYALADAVARDIDHGRLDSANKKMSASVGTSLTSLGLAQNSELRSQMELLRNRTVTMGVSSCVENNDMPYYNMWVQGTGGYKNLSESGDESGYSLSSWGTVVGVDVDITEQWTIGMAFSANFGNLHAKAADSAKGDLDSYYVNLFARMQQKSWGHTVLLTGGWSHAKLDRYVDYSLGNYSTHGKTDGKGFGAMYEASYDIFLNEQKSTILQPIFNASIVTTSMDGYDESAEHNAGLRVGKQDMTTTTLAAGGRIMGLFGNSLFGRESYGEFRINVATDLGDDRSSANMGYLASPNSSQTIRSTSVGRTALQLGAALSVPINNNGSIFIDANADFRSKQQSVNGSLGYRYNF